MTPVPENLRSNIWKYYLYSSFMSVQFFMPIVVIFFLANELSFTEIMLLQTVYSVVIVLMEVPTGTIADVIGRKESILIGSLLTTAGCILYATGYTFYQFLAAEITWAVGGTFISGAQSALLYETLQELNTPEDYKKIEGKASMIGLLSTAATSAVGGLLASISLRIPFYCSAVCFFMSIVVALRFYEPLKAKESTIKRYKTIMKESAGLCIKNDTIKWVFICSAGIATFALLGRWFYQPYLQDIGIDITYFGTIFMGFTLFSALNAKYAYKYEEKIGRAFFLPAVFVVLSASFLALGFIPLVFSVGFMFIQQGIRGVTAPIIKYYINEETPSDKRATVLSLHSLFVRGIYAVASPLAGRAVDVYSVYSLYVWCGIILAGFFLLSVRLYHE